MICDQTVTLCVCLFVDRIRAWVRVEVVIRRPDWIPRGMVTVDRLVLWCCLVLFGVVIVCKMLCCVKLCYIVLYNSLILFRLYAWLTVRPLYPDYLLIYCPSCISLVWFVWSCHDTYSNPGPGRGLAEREADKDRQFYEAYRAIWDSRERTDR